MAECHPVGFRFVMEARERGATIIHVDPRFTRTSANADIYAPLRPGTDIAFLGGLINYVHRAREVLHGVRGAPTPTPPPSSTKTSATPRTSTASSPATTRATRTTPAPGRYEGESPAAAGYRARTGESFARRGAPSGHRPRDETLQRPALRLPDSQAPLRALYAGDGRAGLRHAAGRLPAGRRGDLTANSGRDRTTAFCYAVGWTQHTVGVQNIRAAAILQLLLGNIGRPGGGILALRGHAAIQGSTDIPTLYNLLPGYLQMPLDAQHDASTTIMPRQSGADRLVAQHAEVRR